MRFLADENFTRLAVAGLRDAGLDVHWIAETNPGAPDEVGALAVTAIESQASWEGCFGVVARHPVYNVETA